jgi:hypothetical protein
LEVSEILYTWYQPLASISSPGCFPLRSLCLCGEAQASGQRGAIYDFEMQLSTHSGPVKRIVFYGCEVYAGQLKAGTDLETLATELQAQLRERMT